MGLEQEIKERALALGFDAVGITDASPLGPEHAGRFEAWLRAGCAGRMGYMHRHQDKRLDPGRLRKGARSVIVVALNYKPPASRTEDRRVAAPGAGTLTMAGPDAGESSFKPETSATPIGQVAMYAQYEDYHPFLKALLRELAAFLGIRAGRQDRFKICVDSAPAAEKALAARAGLGFIGRNHLLIHPRLGPQILLGELLTAVPLQPDRPAEGTCAGCHRCLDACPTGALRPDGLLDATRCISYRTQYAAQGGAEGTAECRDTAIAGNEPATMPSHPAGDWLFGCDECLRACPYYQQAPACTNRRFRFYPDRARLPLREVLDLNPAGFETRFHDSPLRRLGLEGLKHNARACSPKLCL